MQRILLDTSVYIKSLRLRDERMIQTRTVVPGTALWLSAVVLEELYAGAHEGSVRTLERLERDFSGARRVLTPNLGDWIAAGRILAKIGTKYGFDQIGRTRLTNDTLIAVSSARTGTRVLTANPKDFERIGEFRQFDWELLQDSSSENRGESTS